MWAHPHHLTTWRSPGGDQEFLKWGGKRVVSRILHNLSFCCEENFNAHYLWPLHHLKCLKKVDILLMNLFTLILHPSVKKTASKRWNMQCNYCPAETVKLIVHQDSRCLSHLAKTGDGFCAHAPPEVREEAR